MLDSLLESAPEGIVANDAEGRLSLFNSRARDWHGGDPLTIPSEQLTQHFDLFEADGETPLALGDIPLLCAWKGETVRDREICIKAKGQPLRRVTCNGQAFFDADGKRLGAVVVMHDITERQRYQQQVIDMRRRLQAVIDASTEVAIIATDRAGLISLFNSGAERLLGYPASEVVGHYTPLKFHLPAEVERHAAELSRLYGEPVRDFEALTARPRRGDKESGDWTFVERDAQQRPLYFVSQIQGITEQRQLDRLKSEFVAVGSHELRTPLTSIKGALSLVNNGVLGKVPPAMSEMLSVAERNTERLGHLVNDLLDWEKLAADQLAFAFYSYDLHTLLEDAVASNHGYAESYGMHLVLDGDARLSVAIDSLRFGQVMANLLSNAIKFSPPEEVATVGYRVVDGQSLCVVMLDIDHFKRVNDSYGHLIGDEVIRALASLLMRRLRESDLIGRYGGKEFLLVLHDCDESQAVRVVDELRESFARFQFLADQQAFACTYSAGVMQASVETLIGRADQRLYRAKSEGRNRVVAAG